MSNTLVILIPVYNDWNAVAALIKLLDTSVAGMTAQGYTVNALLIDDGSTDVIADTAASDWSLAAIGRVDILRLRRNLGHQRAIAVGLCYVEQHCLPQAVIVMDGDGEDLPTDVPLLFERYLQENESKAVFAERARRTESFSFRLFYALYKGAHVLLTGNRVRVGNFSILPAALVSRIVCVSDLWNHYAAAAFKARLPIVMIPLARGYRLDGTSKMVFVSLVIHGLSAISVNGDRVGVRLLVATALAFGLLFFTLSTMLLVRFGFGIILPNFVKTAALILLVIVPQMVAIALMFVFSVLASRDSASFLPIRDYGYFVHRVQALWPPQPA